MPDPIIATNTVTEAKDVLYYILSAFAGVLGALVYMFFWGKNLSEKYSENAIKWLERVVAALEKRNTLDDEFKTLIRDNTEHCKDCNATREFIRDAFKKQGS